MERKMIFSLFLIAFYFVAGEASAPSPKCLPNMIQSDEDPTICYLFVNNASTFDDAEKFCKQNNGHLTPVFDTLSNFFISEKAYNLIKNSESFWLGGKTANVNGATIWMWIWQNSLIFYSDWDRGQPSKNACISSTRHTALWSSEDCTVAKPFVCQIPAIVDICDPEWTYFKPPNNTMYPDGMCYRYMNQPDITFAGAQNVCVSQNANLASIHSEEENLFLSYMAAFGSVQASSIQGAFIGLQYTDFQWKWLDGTKMDYVNWGANRPNDEVNKVVGSFYPNQISGVPQDWTGKWDNFIITKIFNRFICKKSPNIVSVTEKLL